MADILRVSSVEFGKAGGRYQDAALTRPVVVTRDGDVLGMQDFTNAEVEAVRVAEPSAEAERFNGEMEA